ncbi:hypothetical protein [Nocardioides sp. SR21]|uniref:hypothetical protein n=1 Tax=Nocardioides sp. SR21 TaxID=2919501 RepID=UPI001FA9EC1D|nr:hypothetical protein [Nocardioides sp. SR21]
MTLRQVLAFGKEALLLELAVYRALARMVARRPDVPLGAVPIGYGQLVTPMLWLWIFGSAVEVVVLEVVLRHLEAGWAEAIRLPALVVGLWGLLWMLGLLAAHRVRPHLLTEDRLVVRAGLRVWVEVPLATVVAVRAVEQELPSTIWSLHQADELVLVGVSGRCNLELELAAPTALATSKGELVAGRLGLWVDDARAARALIADRIGVR